MAIDRFTARTVNLADINAAELSFEGAFRYMAHDFMHRIADRFVEDIDEAGKVAYRALFTEALAKQISEHHAAALEGALKGIRKRKLVDA